MKFDFFVAHRLIKGDGTARRTPPGIIIGVVGVALAYMIMLLSMSVVTGFKQEIRAKILGFDAPLTITGMTSGGVSTGDEELFSYTEGMRRAITATIPDATASAVTDRRILIKTDSAFAALNLRCLRPDYDRTFISNNIVEGSFNETDTAADEAAISKTTANQLGLSVGDRVTVHLLRNGDLVSRRLTVKGIFDTHFGDYDKAIAFGNMAFSRGVQRDPTDTTLYSAIELRGMTAETGAAMHPALQSALLAEYASSHTDDNMEASPLPAVRDAMSTAAVYFSWLDLLDTNVVVIIILMTFVAGFTLISCLFILILERVNLIGTLKAMGCRNHTIRSIFILMSQHVVVKGLLWGNIFGLIILLSQHYLKIIPLDPESYYLNYVPMAIDLPSILLLNVATVIVSVLILVVPSQLISSLSPIESMRYNE